MTRAKRTPTAAERIVIEELGRRTRDLIGLLRHVASVAEMASEGPDSWVAAEYTIDLGRQIQREGQVLRPLIRAAEAIGEDRDRRAGERGRKAKEQRP